MIPAEAHMCRCHLLSQGSQNDATLICELFFIFFVEIFVSLINFSDYILISYLILLTMCGYSYSRHCDEMRVVWDAVASKSVTHSTDQQLRCIHWVTLSFVETKV